MKALGARITSWRVPLAILLVCHAALLAWSAWSHSPTYQEPGHLAAGISHCDLGTYTLFSVNPPLVRMLAATPVLRLNPKTNWSHIADPPIARPEYAIGVDFFVANGPVSVRWIALARWACIPFSLLGAWVCFSWANRLYGSFAGLMAASLWCTSPYVLGHAAVIAPDAHAAALAAAAAYAYWRWLHQPDWSRALVAGVFLGLAQLSKFTLLAFYPVFLILWIVVRCIPWIRKPSERRQREIGMLLVIMAISVCLINVGYTFEGSCQRLGDFRFHTVALSGAAKHDQIGPNGGNRFATTWMKHLPVPLPRNYVQGIDLQARDFETGLSSYLRGEWSDRGWWYYYLYALAIKMPLGTWGLAAIAVAITCFRRQLSAPWKDELMVLLPGLAIILAVSSQTGLSIHSRYVIPALPFLFIWMSKAAQLLKVRQATSGTRVLAMIVVVMITWSTSSSLWVYPHSISYFNEIVRGPKGGPAHLLNSNIDWSQDLLYLKKWLETHTEVDLNGLDYYGNGAASLIGLPGVSEPPPAKPEAILENDADRLGEPIVSPPGAPANEFGPKPGWYALSVNRIYALSRRYRYFLRFEPAAYAGYSIYIYHITLDDANRVRRWMRLPELTAMGSVSGERPSERFPSAQ